MTRDVRAVTPGLSLRELEALFETHDFNSFPVMADETVVGIVTKFDVLKTFAFTTAQMVPHYDDLMRQTVGDLMTKIVIHVELETPLTRVLQLMVEMRTRSLVVLDAEHRLAGMISREDVMRALRDSTPAE